MARFEVPTGLIDEMIDPTLAKANVSGGPLHGLAAWMAGAMSVEPTDLQMAGDLTLRGPITRWIAYVFGNPRMTRTQADAMLPIQPGDPNPFFQIIDAVSREGGSVVPGNGPLAMASIFPVVREEWRKPGYAMACVAVGGECYDLPVYFQIPDPTSEVPATFPNRVATFDGEGNAATYHTWETWGTNGSDGHGVIDIGGTYYRSSCNIHSGGDPIKASEWAVLYGTIPILSVAEFVAIRDA